MNFSYAGKSSDVLKAEGKTMKLAVKNDKIRSIEPLADHMEKEFY